MTPEGGVDHAIHEHESRSLDLEFTAEHRPRVAVRVPLNQHATRRPTSRTFSGLNVSGLHVVLRISAYSCGSCGHKVDGVCRGIDDWRTGDANVRADVTTIDAVGDSGQRHGTVVVRPVDLPTRCVEPVDHVILGDHHHGPTTDQGLGINLPAKSGIEDVPKSSSGNR